MLATESFFPFLDFFFLSKENQYKVSVAEFFRMCPFSFEMSLIALGVLKHKGERLAFPERKDQRV